MNTKCFPRISRRNDPKIILAKTHPKIVKEDDEVTKCLKEIEEELFK